MPLSGLALTMALLLGADSAPSASASTSRLPRSSIAAVLLNRDELGLDEVQVRQLEEREAALQKQVAGLREQLAARTARGHTGGGSPEDRPRSSPTGSDAGTPAPLSPSAAALPQGATGGGGHRGGGTGGHRGHGDRATKAPADSAPTLQTQIDDADTAAWLGAEPLLKEGQREKARAIAEAYREALADERETGKVGH